jgi:hypothetical protein
MPAAYTDGGTTADRGESGSGQQRRHRVNSPRFISCLGPLIAGTLIGYFGGYGPTAMIIGLFFILGIVAAPFLPETNGKPLPETLMPVQPAVTS